MMSIPFFRFSLSVSFPYRRRPSISLSSNLCVFTFSFRKFLHRVVFSTILRGFLCMCYYLLLVKRVQYSVYHPCGYDWIHIIYISRTSLSLIYNYVSQFCSHYISYKSIRMDFLLLFFYSIYVLILPEIYVHVSFFVSDPVGETLFHPQLL